MFKRQLVDRIEAEDVFGAGRASVDELLALIDVQVVYAAVFAERLGSFRWLVLAEE